MAIYNPTQRDPIRLLSGILSTHDYAAVIRQASPPPENLPCLEFLLGPATNIN